MNKYKFVIIFCKLIFIYMLKDFWLFIYFFLVNCDNFINFNWNILEKINLCIKFSDM